MLRQIDVSLPPTIASLDYRPAPDVAALIEQSARAVVALDADSRGVIQALGGLLLRTESVASSRIERVDASIDAYARAAAGLKSDESATSMVAATTALAQMIEHAGAHRDIRLDDLLEAHATLMHDDPLDGRYAGRLRDVQNWIGGSDYSPIGAVHVPPPPETVPGYLDDLLRFANRDDVPAIAQAAIVHAQFESIHPFTDGNGRIGRALINAVLRRRGITSRTVVPVASAMLAERERYFSLVNAYRDGSVTPFVRELADAAVIASSEARASANRLDELPSEWTAMSRPRAGSAAAKILGVLAEHPILSADEAVRLTGSPVSSVYTAMERLERDGVIHQVTDRQRNRVWGATDVLAELDALNRRIGEAVRASSATSAPPRTMGV
ncbi:Fic family protein [Agromyces hippuratus]|uniref:Fic family protein n=2 Tax=Agromyces hippuratus TaxID=286438 RepID=A0A852WQQ0_9MICO|nr:Fic family protein [Agromyces hippuratus]NYG20276.1 Fic family protein [Agromyces hippuratus]